MTERGEVVTLPVVTRHPQDYVLHNEADGTRWRGTTHGIWARERPPSDEALAWADRPWRAAAGWLRSASGSKIIEVGDHDGCIWQRDSELIAAAVNAYQPVPEGCTPADAMVLRDANHALADENARLREALRKIMKVMGPATPPCCGGCKWEWDTALEIVRDVLPKEEKQA